MQALPRKPASVYGLLALGLIPMVGPALPQYRFSPFWFSLAVLIAGHDLFRKRGAHATEGRRRDRTLGAL